MTTPTKILSTLTIRAQTNADTAFAILGARPGPGIDITFTPTNPVSANYTVVALTDAGRAFLSKFWHGTNIVEGGRMAQRMKSEAAEWGLSFHVDWSGVVSTKVDP